MLYAGLLFMSWCGSLALPVGRGLNIHFDGPGMDGEAAMMGRAAEIIRMDLNWQETEPSRGVYNFSRYDELQESLAEHGMRLWLILDYSNPIYCPNMSSPITPEQQEAFARWAAAAAVHYQERSAESPGDGEGAAGGKRELRSNAVRGASPALPSLAHLSSAAPLPLPYFEIYNEPNIGFWKNASGMPAPNASQYADLAMRTASAVRAAAPSALLIAPCTSGLDLGFMNVSFSRGLLELVDGVAVHPYRRGPPETVVHDYAGLRALMDQFNGGSSRAIISSEWGWTTCDYPCVPSGPNATEDDQARFAVRRFLIDAMESVPVSIFYEWRDNGNNKTMREWNFGIVDADYRPSNASYPYAPKPAFSALSAYFSFLRGAGEAKDSTSSLVGVPSRTEAPAPSPGRRSFVRRLPAGGGAKPGGTYAMLFEGGGVAAWSVGDASDGTCSAIPLRNRTDCGWPGIGESTCDGLGCCWRPGDGEGPQCFFPDERSTVEASIDTGSGRAGCYSATDYLGRVLPRVCSSSTGILNATLEGAVVFFAPVSGSGGDEME